VLGRFCSIFKDSKIGPLLLKKSLLPILLFSMAWCQGQSILDLRLTSAERGRKLSAVLDSLQQKHQVSFFYLDGWASDLIIPEESTTLALTLDELFRGRELSYVEMYPGTIVFIKDPTLSIMRQSAIEDARRDQKKIVRQQFGSPSGGRRKSVTIGGRITDAANDDPLSGASILLSDSSATTTNADGRFSMSVLSGEYLMTVGFVNYEESVIDIAAYEDGSINIKLEELPTVLNEIIVQGAGEREVTQSRLGQAQISVADLKKSPTMLGEADLVKQVQTMPGVTTVGEAASGFNVRGGSVDQNLILYDGMPVFNSAHAFGFLSSFNSHAIRDVSFYRGGIPAEFGGRASSVLDIRSKEGNYEKWDGNIGIGIIASHAMVSGPVVKDKTSIAGSFRSTYSDWLIHSIKSNYADLSKSKVAFYDGTFKITHLFSPNSKLSVSGYASHDKFRLQGDSTFQWTNRLISARFDHRFSENFSFDVTGGITHYSYNINNSVPSTAFDLSYRINTPSLKIGFNWQRDLHRLSFGAQFQYYLFDPGSLVPKEGSNVAEKHMDQQKSFENAVYINDIFNVSEKLSLEGGIRVPLFTSIGVDGVVAANYSGIEPRAAVRYSTGPASSIKGGYTRMYQFLHLITNTAAVTPVDVWQPSGRNFKPQRADQVSIGYFKTFTERKYEASVETFYKYTADILDFRNGARLILNDGLQRDLLRGNAMAYGIETSAGINVGRLTGSINYTYSRSLRQVIGATDEESINGGQIYASNYDQPHIMNLIWRYGITRRYFFTGTFTYRTGRPISIPLSGYYFEGNAVSNFSERNKFRIPDYHRLDLAFVIEGNHKRKKLGDGTWVIGLYNVYARKNAYSVFYKPTATGTLRPYQLSIVGTVLPSVTYNFTF
jgi:TonB-dependent Receptor Plug Domain/CarboxypepD_reg-like domain